eukprot:750687-Hanusia_phi.AAC.2
MTETHGVGSESHRRTEDVDTTTPCFVDEKVWTAFSELKRKRLTALWNSIQLVRRRIGLKEVGTEAILPSIADRHQHK